MNFGQDPQDFHNCPHYQPYMDNQPQDKRSRTMTTAAIVLGSVAVFTVCCTYVSIICGSLGITFALLSKGGELTMSPHAKTALWVSVLAIVMTLLLVALSFMIVMMYFGSVDAFWKAYMEMMRAYGIE